MNKKKLIVLCVLALLLVGLIAGLVVHDRMEKAEQERLRIYNETYLVMDGMEYRRDSTQLDLSNQEITEFEKLQELTALQKLDLRNTGMTVQQYDTLQAALPDCDILWSVPFQGRFYDSTTSQMVLEHLSDSDLPMFAYLRALSSINADQCQDYAALFALMEQYPQVSVTYAVPIGEISITSTQEEATIVDPQITELLQKLRFLPNLKTVTLSGSLPSNEELLQLKGAFPGIKFHWDLTVCGVSTNTFAEFLDLSNIKMGSMAELEAALPCFYNLRKVDMVNCGFSNPDMEALNNRHPGTSFVWKVSISGSYFRTDIRYFMLWKLPRRMPGDLSNLRYCTEVEVLDFGHFGVSDLSFIEYMPKLRYLLILETKITDLTAVGNCTSLEYAELATINVTDFWPLTNLTNLKCLNLSHTPYFGVNSNGDNVYSKFGDFTPLLQMTWLDRLWLANSRVGEEGQAILNEALPNVEMCFYSISATDRGWRYAPGYYEMRDILDMAYFVW